MNGRQTSGNSQYVIHTPEKKSWLAKNCRDYSLSALAIVFGIGMVLAGLILMIAALIPVALLGPEPAIGYFLAAVWLGFALWLWISLIIIGKTNKESRVSVSELVTIQVLFFILSFGNWIASTPEDIKSLYEISMLFEFCVLGFYTLYLLLALCVWVRLPWRSYVSFLMMLGIVLLQLKRFGF